ncbi:DUF1592 domain-containing protein [Prosthecobacter sp.]|jgi:hypothetical protein|uniref:DUF1592 domain-containing protein n=1 Tax=Prosthecobacter sp. TaxID=1965333 RepID=UPI0037835738
MRCVLSVLFLLSVPAFAEIRPLLQKYCLDCHNADKQKGDVDLTHFGSPQKVLKEFKLWQTMLQQVEEEEMPPKKPLPSREERHQITAFLRKGIDSVDWSQQKGIEHVTLPRLTKTEYNNTLRDLLGIDFEPGKLLLDDGPGLSGFTNDRDALFISPALAEQLFDAADYALQCMLNLRQKPYAKHFEAENMLMTERGSKPEDLPGGGVGYSLAGAGQRTLYDEVIVPADGWYRFTVKHVGRGGDAGMRLRIDNEPRARLKCLDNTPKKETIELLLRAGSHQMTWNIDNTGLRAPTPVPVRKAKKAAPKGGYRVFDQKKAAPLVKDAAAKNAPKLPVPADASDEVKKLTDNLNRHFQNMQMRIEYLRAVTPEGNPSDLRSFYNLLPERTEAMVAVKHLLAKAMKLPVDELDRQIEAANVEKLASNRQVVGDSLEVLDLPFDPASLIGSAAAQKVAKPIQVGAPGVDWILIEGPISPAGSKPREIFQSDAKAALSAFLPKAFRRPLRAGELEKHLSLSDKAQKRGESPEQALKLAFAAALTSPSFLFRDELRAGKLDDHQLASRLSYFLWMSLPDDELRALADAGKLREDATLRAQVKRMLADPRSRAFTSTFLGQWLGFAGLGTEHVPDARKFRDFTPALADAMKLEPVLVLENLLRNGGSLTRLLDARETFANDALAALYGLDLSGDAMQPVKFTDDKRAGLLGMAAVLTASSTPNRTSPVIRGKWVLETLLGRKLAEPPADAGQLDDKAGDRGKTLREELAAHRRNESCASCHDKIDPIGFGLENFDAIGRFRDKEAGKPVDASGTLPGGIEINGPAELRSAIQKHYSDEFIRNVTQRLTAFALGRALKPQDEGLIRQLLADLKKNNQRADVLIKSIVLSEAFRTQGSAN